MKLRAEQKATFVYLFVLALAFLLRFVLQPQGIMRITPLVFWPLVLFCITSLCQDIARGKSVPQELLDQDLSGKLVLITGAARGEDFSSLGFECALQLAKQGATVVIVCRSRARNDETAAALRERAVSDGHTKELDLVTRWSVNLESLASVRALAVHLRDNRSISSIDIFLAAAGCCDFGSALHCERHPRVGRVLAVNVLGHHLLTQLLLPKLRRVVTVASVTHTFIAQRDILTGGDDEQDNSGNSARAIEAVVRDTVAWSDNLTEFAHPYKLLQVSMGTDTRAPALRYSFSKYLCIALAHFLNQQFRDAAARNENRGAAHQQQRAVVSDPGLVSTSFARNMWSFLPTIGPYIFTALMTLSQYIPPFLRSPADGASSLIVACLADLDEDNSGGGGSAERNFYFNDGEDQTETALSDLGKNVELALHAIEQCRLVWTEAIQR